MNQDMMLSFEYRAYDRKGQLIKGIERASSQQEAQLKIKKQGLVIIELRPIATAKIKGRVSIAHVEELTSQLALLLSSGLKIDKALAVLAQSNEHQKMKMVLSDLYQTVSQGGSLSSAMTKHDKVFPSLYCEMVRIGEGSGRLTDVFQRLAENLRFQRELSKKIVQASVYPCFILVVCLLALVAIFNFVVPSMSGLFESLTELPVYTALLIDVSNWVQAYQWHTLFGLIAFVVIVVHSSDKAWFKHWIANLLDAIPLTRRAVLLVERIRYSASMSLMLESGVDLATSMSMAAKTVKTPGVVQQLEKAQQQVSQGQSVSHSLAGLPLFDALSLSLLQVGEETGQLGKVFAEVNLRARSTFESWVLKLTTMLEPIMIVFMGLIVGSVVVIMLLSIVSVNDVTF